MGDARDTAILILAAGHGTRMKSRRAKVLHELCGRPLLGYPLALAEVSADFLIEFDLDAMMEGEVYADFALLWLVCHQSRVESDKAVDCWLEKWSKLARDQGWDGAVRAELQEHKALDFLTSEAKIEETAET